MHRALIHSRCRLSASVFLAVWIVLGAEFAVTQESLQITGVGIVDDAVKLTWNSNADYHEVQASASLVSADWEPKVLTSRREASIPLTLLDDESAFLRVAATVRRETAVISDERRLAILDEIFAMIETFPGTDPVAESAALAEFIGGIPEMEGTGVHPDTSVYAQFKDGRPFVIINNRPPSTPDDLLDAVDAEFLTSEEPFQDPQDVRQRGLRVARSSASATGMPVSRRAILFQAEGIGINAPMLSSLVPAFSKSGCQVTSGDASLTNFLGVSNFGNDIGVFYIDSHGVASWFPVQIEDPETGDITLDEIPLFMVATSTEVTPGNEMTYKPLHVSGEIGYAQLGPSILKGLERTLDEAKTYYLVTPSFVERRWRFGKNSFVFIDACHSAREVASSFRRACLAVGAAAYAGWTDAVHDSWAYESTTRPLFDSLLGGSRIFQGGESAPTPFWPHRHFGSALNVRFSFAPLACGGSWWSRGDLPLTWVAKHARHWTENA